MCEPEGGGVPLGGVLAAAGIVAGGLVALRVLAAAAPFLAVLGAAAVVLGAASVPVLRWARRFSVVCLPARAVLPAEPPPEVVAAAKALHPGPERKAIEAPRPGVTVTLSAREHAERMSR